MVKYGKIVNGELIISSIQFEGYKPIVYADIPESFDQTTQYIIETDPVEEAEQIVIGVEVHNLEPDEGDKTKGEQSI